MKNQEWPPGGDKDKGKFQLNENQLRERVPTLRCQIWHITNNTPKMRSKVRHVIKYILMSHITWWFLYDTRWLYVQSQWKLNMSVPEQNEQGSVGRDVIGRSLVTPRTHGVDL